MRIQMDCVVTKIYPAQNGKRVYIKAIDMDSGQPFDFSTEQPYADVAKLDRQMGQIVGVFETYVYTDNAGVARQQFKAREFSFTANGGKK